MWEDLKKDWPKLVRAYNAWKASGLTKGVELSFSGFRWLCIRSCSSYYYNGYSLMMGTTLCVSLIVNMLMLLAVLALSFMVITC